MLSDLKNLNKYANNTTNTNDILIKTNNQFFYRNEKILKTIEFYKIFTKKFFSLIKNRRGISEN